MDFEKEKCSGTNCTGYRGKQTLTKGGYTCQRWDSQSPHDHEYSPKQYPDGDLDNNNYCRNPNTDTAHNIWCYTTDSNKRWEYCEPITNLDEK